MCCFEFQTSTNVLLVTTVMKMGIVPTQRVLITAPVILDTRGMEFHVPVRYMNHTQKLIMHGFDNLVRLL